MKIKIVDRLKRSFDFAVIAWLEEKLDKIRNQGQAIQEALIYTTKNHVKTIYPDSNHYSPDRITIDSFRNKSNPEGSINIDIPGITRAYHDIDIRPIRSNWLTIPMHASSYGKKAGEFQDLIHIKKGEKHFLAQKNGTGITFLYYLSKHVHQFQDRRLMPSDDSFGDNISSRIAARVGHMNLAAS